MAFTTFAGPVRVGRPNRVGTVPATRILSLPVTAIANTDLTLDMPPCQILGFRQMTTLAYTAATITLQVGNAAAGAQLVAAADIKALAARSLAIVAAGVPLMTWAGGLLYVRLVQGTPTAVGAGALYVEYLPLEDGAAA
jgi:hypothetical protein